VLPRTPSLALLALGTLAAHPLAAQPATDRVTIQITDVRGNAIPFAVVTIGRGAMRVADDSGRVTYPVKPADSLNVTARRIGFQPYVGWSRRPEGKDYYLADLVPMPRSLDPVNIKGRRDTPLARAGFYDRLERVQRGAAQARFITPEELEVRNPIKLTQMFAGESFVKVTPMNGKQLLLGRGATCAMTIVLDGHLLTGTLEEAIGNPNPPPISSLTQVDDVITAGSVAAIEVYASNNSVPVELQRAAGPRMSQGCGLIAVWTGSRR